MMAFCVTGGSTTTIKLALGAEANSIGLVEGPPRNRAGLGLSVTGVSTTTIELELGADTSGVGLSKGPPDSIRAGW